MSGMQKQQIPLPIGLFVHADINGKTVDEIISLPRSVIRNNNQVLVVDAENKMYFREVDIFRLEEQLRSIEIDLKAPHQLLLDLEA